MIVMQLLGLRSGFLTLTFVAIASSAAPCAIASLGGVLRSFSNSAHSENQPGKTTVTNVSEKQMDHGGMMNHNMTMDLGPADASYDLRFIDAMIPHHQGAVEMAKVALQNSKRPQLKKLANDIIKAQNQEIAQMKQWRQAWYPKAGDKPIAYDAQMGHMMEMTSEQMKGMMMSRDLGGADAEFELRFIDAMIPHHEGAVTMAQDALSKSKRPEIKKLAQDIITSQQQEIKQMKQWRQEWYKKVS